MDKFWILNPLTFWPCEVPQHDNQYQFQKQRSEDVLMKYCTYNLKLCIYIHIMFYTKLKKHWLPSKQEKIQIVEHLGILLVPRDHFYPMSVVKKFRPWCPLLSCPYRRTSVKDCDFLDIFFHVSEQLCHCSTTIVQYLLCY